MKRLIPVMVLAGCASAVGPEDRRDVQTGTWGGEHVSLVVSQTGAVIEFDCAHGMLDEPLKVDSKGGFDVRGRFVREHGGPILDDEKDVATPARYAGSIDGREMILSATLENGQTMGPFRLVLGQPPRLVKCL